jgi:hypothetical protein
MPTTETQDKRGTGLRAGCATNYQPAFRALLRGRCIDLNGAAWLRVATTSCRHRHAFRNICDLMMVVRAVLHSVVMVVFIRITATTQAQQVAHRRRGRD